jgi:hypothetical protein
MRLMSVSALLMPTGGSGAWSRVSIARVVVNVGRASTIEVDEVDPASVEMLDLLGRGSFRDVPEITCGHHAGLPSLAHLRSMRVPPGSGATR